MKRLVAVLLLYAAAVTADMPISWKDLQANIDSWIKGPVSLIITDQEKAVYQKLKTPEEKMQFIKIFWARRDPILRTYENEFKQEFYRRVDYANQNFVEGQTPGWKSARGQVYVAFGPPSRVDHQSVEGSTRPGLLWVYDTIPSSKIPRNEALFFVWREYKYVLMPPVPDPGDRMAAIQREADSAFRYQSIPSTVQQAFGDIARATVIDENKKYDQLLYSVKSTEKFGIAEIDFETRLLQSAPPQVQIMMLKDKAPVYDNADQKFAEFFIKQELIQGDRVVTSNEREASFLWGPSEFEKLKEITVLLPALQAPAGHYELSITVQDRISNVSETKKIPISL